MLHWACSSACGNNTIRDEVNNETNDEIEGEIDKSIYCARKTNIFLKAIQFLFKHE